MNILITGGSWDERNAGGNTLSNVFDRWGQDCLYYISTREAPPFNSVCNKYYRITTISIIRHFLQREEIGKSFIYNNTEVASINTGSSFSIEKNIINSIHRYKMLAFYHINDWVWNSERWKNNKFKAFLKEANPQIQFAFASGTIQLFKIINTVGTLTKAKTILFITDDVYGVYSRGKGMRFHQMKERFEILMKLADKVYGASENLCDEYEKIFDRKILPLYKGCDLSLPIKNKPNKPLRIVYAGNLLYGRAETLSRLSEAIRLVNADEEKAALEIYTGTTFSPQIALLLKTGPGTDIYSARPYEEIKSIMNDADVVLHVESFEDEQIANVRLSFSTKIIDCLQSGSGILAIGPARIASIEYLRKIDGVHVVDNPDDILARLQQIVDQPVQLIKQAIKIREFALEHHDIKTVHERLRADFSALLGECDL